MNESVWCIVEKSQNSLSFHVVYAVLCEIPLKKVTSTWEGILPKDMGVKASFFTTSSRFSTVSAVSLLTHIHTEKLGFYVFWQCLFKYFMNLSKSLEKVTKQMQILINEWNGIGEYVGCKVSTWLPFFLRATCFFFFFANMFSGYLNGNYK